MATKNQRKVIPKMLRFEVFKRDAFRCQYCGRSSPDVVLEVDHVCPVSGGGENDLLNLITSCRDCNQGKGKRRLSDNAEVTKQRQMLDELNEKRNQVEMMIRWKQSLRDLAEEQTSQLAKLIKETTGRWIDNQQGRLLEKCIKEFGFTEAYEAVEIALDKYERFGLHHAIGKVGGICYNRKHGIKGGSGHGQQNPEGEYLRVGDD